MRVISWLLILTALSLLFFPSILLAADPIGYAVVRGYVKDSITKAPMADAKVRLKCGTTHFNTATDYSGYYEFSAVPIYTKNDYLDNKTRIIVSAKDYVSAINTTELLPDQNYTLDFLLTTRFKYPIIKGIVTEAQSSQGIAGAVVTVSNSKNTFSSIADNAGNYILRVENKGIGVYSLVASADGYQPSLPQEIKTFPLNTYNINFSLEKISLGVNASPDFWQIGELAPNSKATMEPGEEIVVTSTASQNQTYSLMVVSPDGWNAAQAEVEKDKYIMNACFASDVGLINWDAQEHALSESVQRCTDSKFAADQSGVNITPGQVRLLWLQFIAPASSSVSGEQKIEVIINAEMP